MNTDMEEQPQLVLGMVNPRLAFDKYRFRPGLEWQDIQHQTCGNACGQKRILGTVLPIRPEKLGAVKELCDKWYDSQAGVFGVAFTELLNYRADLQRLLAVDCNTCYREFEEAWYPVDVQFVRDLTPEILPEKLDDLVLWESEIDSFCGSVGRWHLVILGENSD